MQYNDIQYITVSILLEYFTVTNDADCLNIFVH
jgi:hypothetical protein